MNDTLAEESHFRRCCLTIVALSPSLVVGMVVTLVIPILPTIAQHFGDHRGAFVAQYMAAIAGGGTLIGAIVGGAAVDRFGYRLVLISSLLVYVAFSLLIPTLDNATPMLACRFVTGFGSGAYYAATTALVGQKWQGNSRAKLFGLVTSLGAMFGILVMIASGAIAEEFGWRASFFLYALPLPLVLVSLVVTDERRRIKLPSTTAATWAEWRPLVPIYIRGLFLFITTFIVYTQFPLVLSEAGIASAKDRSFIMTIPVACSAIAGLSFAYLHRGLGHAKIFLVILLLYGVGNAMVVGVSGVGTAVLPCLFFGTAGGLVTAYFKHEILANADEQIRGKATGGIISVQYIGHFINPLVIGTLGTYLGMRQALTVAGLALLLWFLVATLKFFRSTHLSKAAV